MKNGINLSAEPEPEPESEPEGELKVKQQWSSKNLSEAFRKANPKVINYANQVLGSQLVGILCKRGCSVFR